MGDTTVDRLVKAHIITITPFRWLVNTWGCELLDRHINTPPSCTYFTNYTFYRKFPLKDRASDSV